jgi:polyhydroxyalkanoate synthesis regulator phasin
MSAIAALTPEERVERVAFLKRLGLGPKGGPSVIPIDHPSRRKPLGLAPIGDDGDKEEADPVNSRGSLVARDLIARSVATMTPEARNDAARIEDIFNIIELPLAIAMDDGDALFEHIKKLRERVSELETARRVEAAELRTTIAELRSEISQMRSIQESARLASRGERGEQGVRGIPGPPGEGKVGPRGAKGEIGPTSKPVAWEPLIDQFQLVPLYGDGSKGAAANLRPFFEHYDAATNGSEDET